ncbi:hypothetical protein HKCCE3408_06135 [Rhodobacterales bacterium HKCCE3408]|nr:hypothetical protein [Rhodobacterales bacterium HKCCE3408]
MTAHGAARAAGDGWRMQQCSRIGAPPLRFSGRRLDWIEAAGPGPRQFLGLYARRKGGFMVALCRLQDGAWAGHVVPAASLEDAINAVEAYCTDVLDDISPGPDRHSATLEELSTNLSEKGRIAAEVLRFRQLAGRALDRWCAIADADTFGKGIP